MSDCASVSSPGREVAGAAALASKSPAGPPRAHHARDQNDGTSPAHSGGRGPTQAPHPQAASDPSARRAAAARWVQRATGLAEPLPCETDAAFRAALRDGVLLCRCANFLWPGLVPGVVERADRGPSGLTRQRLENVTSFLDALQGGGGSGGGYGGGGDGADGGGAPPSAPLLPPEFAFSVADLEHEGADDRPRVADCVLWMRAQHLAMQQQQQQGAPPPTPPPPMSPAAAEAAAAAGAGALALTTPGHRSVQAAAGVTRLMQQCTAMLRERMFLDASGGSPGAPSPGGGQHQQQQTPLRAGAARLATPTPRGTGAGGGGGHPNHHPQASSYRGPPSLTPSPAPPLASANGGGRPPIGSAVAARYGGNNTGAGVLAAAAAAAASSAATPSPSAHGGHHHHPSHHHHALATPPPDQAIEAMGPILEGVLGSLTQEYERRLLSKDHELAAARDAVASLQRQAAELRAEAEAARRGADARGADAARLADAGAAEEAERLRAEVEDLRSLLEDRERALADLERRAGASAEAVREREAELERELDALREDARAAGALQEKYARAVSENRRLYNAVQDLKGSIRVFCRVRPPGATGDGGPAVLEPGAEDGELALWDVSAAARSGQGGGGSSAAAAALAAGAAQRKVFKLDRVFGPGSTQGEVYEDTAPLVRCVLDGYNVCIFAYGQTGSGKTHTMSGGGALGGGGGGNGGGEDDEEDQRGINYRALDDLFELQESRRGEIEYRISVQMLEIYNEQLRDLLAGAGGGAGGGGLSSSAADGGGSHNNNPQQQNQNQQPTKLEILSTLASGCNVPGAVQVEVRTAADVARLMSRGSRARATGGTRMNERSSRSHQVVTVLVAGTELSTGARSHACLHLVDLAGSERVARSEASGDRLVEAQHINKSLSALGDVMAALAARGGGGGGSGGGSSSGAAATATHHVPFRNSKLTHLLQDSLSGNAKVMMFVHVSPEASSSGESLSTLKFASRVSEVTLGPARRNGESGRVFEAREAALAARRSEERREREAAALRGALEVEARRVDELSAENERLKAALAAAVSAARGGGSGGGAGTGPSPGRRASGDGGGGCGPPRVPRLSLGAATGGGDDYGAPLRSARLSAGPSAIPVVMMGGEAVPLPPRPAAAQAAAATTPPRGGGGGGGGGSLRPLSPGLSLTPPAPYFGGGAEAMANPGSGGVVREVSSSQRHIERLAAARGGRTPPGSGGGANDGSLTARGGGRPSGDGSLTARGQGYSARASDVAMPMTARAHRSSGAGFGGGGGGAGVGGLRASVAGGVPRASAAAAGGGFSSSAGAGAASQYPSGSLTARGGGTSTARGGGRWK